MKKDIETFENFLSKEDYEVVYEDAFNKIQPLSNQRNQTQFRISHTLWDKRIIEKSSVVLIYHVQDESVIQILNEECLSKLKKIPETYMYYYWTNGSYIPWHDDGFANNAGTLYLNENWDKNDGGWYMHETADGSVKSIKPEKNLLTFQSNRAKHCTTPIVPGAPYRVTVQMFFK